MPNPIIFPSNLSFLGIGRETVAYGTPAAAPALWVPLMDPAWKPDQKQLQNQAMYGDMAALHGVTPGTRSDTYAYKTYLFLDTLFAHMMALLGAADAVTGSADPYTHTTSLKNSATGQPASWTLWNYNGAECWRHTGAVLGTLDVDLKAEALGEVSASWVTQPATSVSAPTNTPSQMKPWPSWNTTVTVNGIQATNYTDVKMSYKRTLEAVQTNDGTQAPYVIFGSDVTGEIDVTGVYQGFNGTPSDLLNLLTNGQPPLSIQTNPVGDANHYALWQHTLVAPESASVKSAFGKYVETQAKYLAVANTTDATDGGMSPVKFQLKNAVSTAY